MYDNSSFIGSQFSHVLFFVFVFLKRYLLLLFVVGWSFLFFVAPSLAVFMNSGFKRTLCGGKWESLSGNSYPGNYLTSTGRLGCCPPGTFMNSSTSTVCDACTAGQYSDVDNDDTSCNLCVDQAKCVASTLNTCSTTSGIATKTPCTSVTAPGYYLDGDKVATCATSDNGANAATVTCTNGTNQVATTCNAGYWLDGTTCTSCATSGNGANAATVTCTSGINQVATTCNAGYGVVGSACVACDAFTYAVQGNSAECQPCASGSYTDTGTGTTGTTCTSCATSGNGANAATVTCTSGINQVATTCNAGYGVVGSACVACDAFTYAVQGNSAECQPCASGSYTDTGTGTTGTTCQACDTSGTGANVATVTCTSSTNQVAATCDAGYGLVESACVACDAFTYAVQGNSAECQPCASGSYTDTGTGTTGTTCTSCATSGNGANAATVTCTSSTNQVAATCDAGYGLVESACVACDAFTYAVQGNSAECQPCASGSYTDTGTGTTGTTCTSCATSGNGANAATVTCTSGINQVATTCDAGYGLVESACVACDAFTYAVQGNSAECQPCASGSYTDTGTGTTGTTCTSCATSGNGANAATVTCTSGINQVATTCNAGYGVVGSACVAKCSLADQLVGCTTTQLAEIAVHYRSQGQC